MCALGTIAGVEGVGYLWMLLGVSNEVLELLDGIGGKRHISRAWRDWAWRLFWILLDSATDFATEWLREDDGHSAVRST